MDSFKFPIICGFYNEYGDNNHIELIEVDSINISNEVTLVTDNGDYTEDELCDFSVRQLRKLGFLKIGTIFKRVDIESRTISDLNTTDFEPFEIYRKFTTDLPEGFNRLLLETVVGVSDGYLIFNTNEKIELKKLTEDEYMICCDHIL